MEMVPLGCVFRPTDDELVSYYLSNKVGGVSQQLYAGIVHDFDVFGEHEPWEIWEIFRGFAFKNSVAGHEDLYFFTKLKKTTPKAKKTYRKVGSGTWKGQATATSVYSDEKVVTGSKKRFHYENSNGRDQQDGVSWIMFEYSICPPPQSDDYVLCQIRKKYPSSYNLDDHDSDHETGKKKKRKLCADDHPGLDHAEQQNQNQRHEYQQPLPSSSTLMVMESSSYSLANPHDDQQNTYLGFDRVEQQYQQPLPSSPTLMVMESSSSSLANPHDYQQNIYLGLDHVEQQNQQPVLPSSSSNPDSINVEERVLLMGCDQQQYQQVNDCWDYDHHDGGLGHNDIFFDHQPLPSPPTISVDEYEQGNISLCVPDNVHHVEQQLEEQHCDWMFDIDEFLDYDGVPDDVHHVEQQLEEQQQQHCDWKFDIDEFLDYDGDGEPSHNQPLLQSVSILDLGEIF
ncbi:hypothetical protein FNV43_RR26821 [Rhamnella rubrinervis]|uniref:NAC domain-containing protein n=1 Tax=Rhamnella rubrinervis TaxID=2594499 RepID=A0A8K0DVP1_9ROSA|nr:hypothetical protein FNV43_RR26821 [Rhamnella rubrinervis]